MGSKPMSIHQYIQPRAAIQRIVHHPELTNILYQCFWPPDIHEIAHLFNPEQLKLKRGWETLNKYIQRFPMKRFSLFTLSSPDSEVVVIAIVDKIKLTQCVSQNFEDFQELLQEVKPEELLEDNTMYSFLQKISHDGLIGTLLGFGRENAWLFHKCKKIKMSPSERPMQGVWQDEESDYLRHICLKCKSFQPWDVSDLFYPTFACDPLSEETKQLQQNYREERKKIIEYYQGRDVVKATLSLFYSS